MTRLSLTDRQWLLIEPHCLGKKSDPGRSGTDNRMFIEGILWIARTGSPWRDLPCDFGKQNTAFKRYRDWVEADVFAKIFEALSGDPDMEYACVDATIVKVHRHGHGHGAKRELKIRPQANRKGGWTTKILVLCDALGNLGRFVLLPGNRYDTIGVAALIDEIDFDVLLGDKAFDANWIVEELDRRGTKVVISQRPQRVNPIEIDLEMYKWLHLIEDLFCKLKEFKRIAMRACKTDQSFQAMIYLCSAIINST